MKARLLRLSQNPLVIIPPIVLALVIGWQQYTYAGRDLSLPSPDFNLLPNSNFAEFGNNGVPVGWQLTKNGNVRYDVGRGEGYASGNSFNLTVSAYRSGDVALVSPKVAIQPGKTYLFKSYYSSNSPFSLLMRSYYTDDSSSLHFVQKYDGDDGVWSTVSSAFKAADNLANVEFMYRMSSDGQLQLNSPYLEAKQDVYIPPILTGINIMPNSQLAMGNYSAPKDWSTYAVGDNTTIFSYEYDSKGAYLRVQTERYKNGQAKWQYMPQSVRSDQYYKASLEYRSDVPVSLVVEYVLQNGGRQEQQIAHMPPAGEWTTVQYQFQVPSGAVTMQVSTPLQQNGTVATRNYVLADITKPGATNWQQPMVSITFDDGWRQSYDNVLPLLQQLGFAATFYVKPSTIETPGYMTAKQLAKLSDSGNEIGTHGYDRDDMTVVNVAALDYQLSRGRDYLREAGFNTTGFAAPNGRYDAEVQWHARKYFDTLRGGDLGINTRQNFDPHDLKVLSITSDTSPQVITDALQLAKAQHGWLILEYHQVGDNANSSRDARSAITVDAFKPQLERIHSSGIKVLPVAEAYKALTDE